MVDRKYIYGADGNPLDDRKLEILERAYADGNRDALRAAVKICARRPAPEWVRDAVLAALNGANANKRGRPRDDAVDYARWDAVRELRERRQELRDTLKPTWEAAYENASEILKGTKAHGEPHSIKASYQRVERLFRSGGGARFHQTG